MALSEILEKFPLTDEEKEKIKSYNLNEDTDEFGLVEYLMRKNENEIIKKIINQMDVNTQNKYGWSFLHIAIRYGNFDIMRWLVEEKNIDINIQDEPGWTPLMEAIIDDKPEAVEYLINKGADTSLRNKRGASAYDLVIKFGKTHLQKYFQ